MKVWGSRYSVDVEIRKGWTDASRLVYVDNRAAYNKVYPGFWRNGSHVTSVGAILDTEVNINVSVMEPST